MKKILFLAAICLPLLFTGCEKRIIHTDVTIYGTVCDAKTYAPIQGADVTLQPSGRTCMTASDGTYQFNNLDISVTKYTVGAYKKGYYKYNAKSVTLNPGESSNVSILLEPEE